MRGDFHGSSLVRLVPALTSTEELLPRPSPWSFTVPGRTVFPVERSSHLDGQGDRRISPNSRRRSVAMSPELATRAMGGLRGRADLPPARRRPPLPELRTRRTRDPLLDRLP